MKDRIDAVRKKLIKDVSLKKLIKDVSLKKLIKDITLKKLVRTIPLIVLSTVMMTGMVGIVDGQECSAPGCFIKFANLELSNNMWGAPGGEDLRQTLYYYSNDKFGWSWDRPNPQSDDPTFPLVMTGLDYWADPDDVLWPGLPKKISDISSSTLNIGYKFTQSPTGYYNLAYDIWTDDTEIMIWLKCAICIPSDYIGNFYDGSKNWKVYQKAPGSLPWNYVAFVAEGADNGYYGQTDLDINFKKMLDYLVNKGKLKSYINLKTIVLGTEVWRGSGKIEINRFNVEVNGKNSGPTTIVNSNNPSVTWNKTYGGPYKDSSGTVQQTKDGGYIIIGNRYEYGSWLIKTDSDGRRLWSKTFNLAGAVDGQQTSDGGYIIAGSKSGYGSWLLKTNNSGYKLWNKTYGVTYGKATAAQQTKDGGYIIAGYTEYNGDSNAWLLKTDNNGNRIWSKTFKGTKYDAARDIQQTSDGGYIIAGDCTYQSCDAYDAWLIKTNSKGNTTWNKTFGGTDLDGFNSVQQTKDGGYIIAGSTHSYGNGDSNTTDVWLVKTNSYGTKLWSKTFGGTSCDLAESVQQTLDGGYIIAGSTCSGSGSRDIWLIKTAGNGTKLWSKTLGGIYWDDADAIQQTRDGGYVVIGDTSSYGAGDRDIWLIKLKKDSGITVTSPNGGENWKRGTSHTIRWTYYGNPGSYVKIDLLKGGTYSRTISSKTLNDGYYNWNIPYEQTLGNDYRIKIVSTNISIYGDGSDNNFAIS